ncbi:MAG: S-layer homology domain-containing protein [Bacillota bacterium]
MKKSAILPALSLLMLFSAVALGEEIRLKDVPADHWAYRAVKTLIEKGYLETYQDDTFQGDKPVDRFTLAVVTARILNDLAAGKTAAADKDGLGLLRRVTTEFQEELVMLAQADKLLDARIKKLEDGALILKDEATEYQMEAVKMLEEVTKKVASLELELKKQRNEIDKLRADLASQKKQIWIIAIAALLTGVLL